MEEHRLDDLRREVMEFLSEPPYSWQGAVSGRVATEMDPDFGSRQLIGKAIMSIGRWWANREYLDGMPALMQPKSQLRQAFLCSANIQFCDCQSDAHKRCSRDGSGASWLICACIISSVVSYSTLARYLCCKPPRWKVRRACISIGVGDVPAQCGT